MDSCHTLVKKQQSDLNLHEDRVEPRASPVSGLLIGNIKRCRGPCFVAQDCETAPRGIKMGLFAPRRGCFLRSPIVRGSVMLASYVSRCLESHEVIRSDGEYG